jgi:hypothetical protein
MNQHLFLALIISAIYSLSLDNKNLSLEPSEADIRKKFETYNFLS